MYKINYKKKLLLVLFSFLCFFAFSQTFEIENPDILSARQVRLNCYWEFFPSQFIDPSIKTSPEFYELGLINESLSSSNQNIFGAFEDSKLFPPDTSISENYVIEDSKVDISEHPLLVDVPSTWNDYRLGEPFDSGTGSGSYRLLVTGLNPNKRYAFSVFDLASNAFSIFINNELIITVGSPNQDYKKTVPDVSMETAYFIPNEAGEANFVIHVSNLVHRNGGLWATINLGEAKVVDQHLRRQLNYAWLCFGALFTVFLYQMFLFIFRKLDFGSFYLALFALVILIRLIVTPVSLIEYFYPNISYALSLKLEYIALILGPMLFLLYLNRKMKNMLYRPIVEVFCLVGIVLSCIVLPANAYIANRFVPINQTYTVITCIYIFIMMILSFIRKPKLDTGLMVFAVIFTIFAAIHDIAAITNIYIFYSSTSLISYAFITFVFIQTLIVARQQEKTHKAVIRLTESYSNINKNYSRFVPTEMLTLLNKENLAGITSGEWISKKVTLLCFDIRQFTSITENCNPKTIFKILNMVLGKIAPIVRKHGGFIEKYRGDGLIAIFPEHGEKAFDCAINIQKELKILQKELKKAKLPEIKGGVGIHYGKIVLGTVGNSERLTQVTVSKDLQIVIDLESITRICKSNIVASRSACERWLEKGKFKAKKLSEDITFQKGISEIAFEIKENY